MKCNILYPQRTDYHSVCAVPAPGLGSRGARVRTRQGLGPLLSYVDGAQWVAMATIKLSNCFH